MPHPEEEQLLRYSDGELPGRTTAQVRSHLEACWQCRTNLEELEKTVGACVRYRTNVLQRHLPAPPAPWTDIYVRFAQIDASLERPSLADRVARLLAWPLDNVKIWAPAAVALMIVFALFYRYRLTPSVQAAELLHKAMVAADTHPAKPHKIQIRTKAHSVTRLAGSEQMLASNAGDQETLNSLKTLFHKANYNWDEPLSARSYSAWRDQLRTKQDRVIQERDSYRIRTNTESGDLMEATLQLRSEDLQPMEGRFEFRNQEWVEITAVAEDVEPSASPIVSGNGPAPENRAGPALEVTPNGVSPTAPALSATAGDELRVLAALHQVGADLGDPVEVSRNGGEIVVSGVGIAPERQQEIQQALGSLPRVVVRFTESAPGNARPEQSAVETPANSDIRQLQARIAEQVGGRAHFEQLAAQVLDMSEPLMARAYALRRLVDRFPVQVEAQLSSRDLETLRQLQREHTSALRQQTLELEQVLKPVLASVGGPTRGEPAAALSADAWQPATEELFQSARRVERLLAVMFGAAPGDSADEQFPGQLLSGLAQLRAKVEAYDHLLAKTEK
jgi:anti-sigma factor RsiW